MLDFDLFTRVIDEAGPSLGRVDFFNYGEAFLHKRAVEMCEYIKTKFPHIYLYTSTNGLALTEENARRLVHSGIDEVTFSIDGASQDTYVQYRQRGDFAKALANLRGDGRREGAGTAATCRTSTGATSCSSGTISDEEMNAGASARRRHRRRPPVLGDHRSPGGRFSRRFVPGSAATRRPSQHEIWDDNNLGNAIPGATPRAQIDVRTLVPGAADPGPARQDRCSVQTRVTNLSNRRFAAQASYGRRLVRLGAQLCAADGTLINRDYARAWLPAPSRRRPARPTSQSRFPRPPSRAGTS